MAAAHQKPLVVVGSINAGEQSSSKGRPALTRIVLNQQQHSQNNLMLSSMCNTRGL
jgi:hypothetical protein